ncbi:MAG: FAD-dependent oxidoreductase [Firmicutes bacterium]|nr:FAD-dependent oxidoreductase [Bacillota bacterium]
MNYVIIGNGAAGVAAAETLRKIDPQGEITIVTSEPYPAYSKCLLASYLSSRPLANPNCDPAGQTLYFKDASFYSKNRIRILYNHRVNSIDCRQKRLKATRMEPSRSQFELSYGRLLIASGSKPVVPPIKGLHRVDSHFLNTLGDAKRILTAAARARKIVVAGAGFVGLEVAFNLRKLGLEVTLIEKARRILPAQLDETAAQIITHELQAEGIKLHLGTAIVEAVPKPGFGALVRRRKDLKGIRLDNGQFIAADILVIATGSAPNLDFVNPKEIRINRGIIVNSRMMASAGGIYAAGDVMELSAADGNNLLSPIWPNAVVSGEYAAYNMAGIPRELDQIAGMQNAAEFREIPLVSMGLVETAGPKVDEFIDFRPGQGIYRKVILKDDRIIGMVFLGDISQSGVIGSLIKSQTPVGHLKSHLLAPNFGYGFASALTI